MFVIDGFGFRPRMLLDDPAAGAEAGGGAPAGGAAPAGGGAPAGGEAGGKEKVVFSKEQQDFINKLLAENKRTLREELAKSNATLQERERAFNDLAASHQEVVDFLKSLQVEEEGGKAKPLINVDGNRDLKDIIKDVVGTVTEGVKARQEADKRLNELEGKLETEAALREIAEEEGLIAERDALVQRALIKIGCTDLKTAMRLFEDNVEIDQDTGKWFIVNDETGEEWPLAEGVDKLLPDYMKKPITDRKGAGSGGTKDTPGSSLAASKTKLTEIDEQIASLKADYNKTRDQSILTKVQQLAREKAKLARDIRSATV